MYKIFRLAVLLSAVEAQLEIPTSYDGPALPYSLYGPGGCSSEPVTRGETLGLSVLGPNTVCEEDVIVNGGKLFSKMESIECNGENGPLFRMYNCTDATCSECDDTPEFEGSVSYTAVAQGLSNVTTCLEFSAVINITLGTSQPIYGQAFDASANLEDVQNYWLTFFGNTCGEEWLVNLTAGVTATSGTELTGGPDPIDGASYCTYAPDTTCYPSSNGWPACCADESCENGGVGGAPACEESPVDPIDGASYCTYAPDTTCYPSSNGWPACCADESCENGGVGGAPACEEAAGSDPPAEETKAPSESTPAPTSGSMVVASTGVFIATYIFGFLLL